MGQKATGQGEWTDKKGLGLWWMSVSKSTNFWSSGFSWHVTINLFILCVNMSVFSYLQPQSSWDGIWFLQCGTVEEGGTQGVRNPLIRDAGPRCTNSSPIVSVDTDPCQSTYNDCMCWLLLVAFWSWVIRWAWAEGHVLESRGWVGDMAWPLPTGPGSVLTTPIRDKRGHVRWVVSCPQGRHQLPKNGGRQNTQSTSGRHKISSLKFICRYDLWIG